MSSVDGTSVGSRFGWWPRSLFELNILSGGCAIGLAIAIGTIVTIPGALPYIAIAIGCIGSALLALRPRVALNSLLIAMPFAAIPGILLQQSGWPTLLKDIFIIVPLYVGVLAAGGVAQLRNLPRPVVYLLLALAALVLVMSIPTLFANPLVALVGLKTWLWYVPMLVVPFVCIRDWVDCRRILRLIVAIAAIPGIVAIVEAVLIYGGNRSAVYAWYGSLASDVTQNFASVNVSSSLLVQRIPSTFDFPAQFFGFSLAMLPICFAVAITDPLRGWRVWGGVAALLVATGGVLSGARSFLTLLPLDLILIVLLVDHWRIRLSIFSVGSVLTLTLIGAGLDLGGIASFLGNLSNFYLVDTTLREFGSVWSATNGLGVGVGVQTGASRYVLGANSPIGIGVEGWYAKVLFETGIAGLAVVLSVWAALVGRLFASRRRLQPTPQIVVSLILIVIVSTIVNLIKGPYLDLDPLNVYFWFLAGLAFRINCLQHSSGVNARN